mmetsp:Transcript_41761/g.81859  ORF Transcript_41761/g.81859 Transcript_41761/m.81859 type:complete len:200 (+) Transcript_41761:101-700(+)
MGLVRVAADTTVRAVVRALAFLIRTIINPVHRKPSGGGDTVIGVLTFLIRAFPPGGDGDGDGDAVVCVLIFFIRGFSLAPRQSPNNNTRSKEMFFITRFNVWVETFGIDRVPPAMRAPHYHVQIIYIVVHRVLCPVIPDHVPHPVLQLVADGVLAGVHVCDPSPPQPNRKLVPPFVGDVVDLSHINTPYVAIGVLQHAQ